MNAPKVADYSPGEIPQGAAAFPYVTAAFEHPLDPNSATLVLTDKDNNTLVAGSVAVVQDSGMWVVKFTANANLTWQTHYSATVFAKASDGTPMAEPFTWTFHTGAKPPWWKG